MGQTVIERLLQYYFVIVVIALIIIIITITTIIIIIIIIMVIDLCVICVGISFQSILYLGIQHWGWSGVCLEMGHQITNLIGKMTINQLILEVYPIFLTDSYGCYIKTCFTTVVYCKAGPRKV